MRRERLMLPTLRPLLRPLPLALLLARAAQAATFQPGQLADPPTGELPAAAPATAAEPLRGSGIQWRFAPWRSSGSLGVEERWLRQEDGRRTRQGLVLGDLDLATYIWQPWFVQVRLGAGFVASRGSGAELGTTDRGDSLSGRVALSVFPASRFPFELRADASDSRSSGANLGTDYRSRRLSLSQGWRPAKGSDSVQLQVERSELTDSLATDTLTTLNLSVLRQLPEHSFDLGLNHSDNHRSDSDLHTLLSTANARHSYHPAGDLRVETLASWNELKFSGIGASSGSEVRQLSSFASWRLAKGSLYREGSAPQVAATARWVESRSIGAADTERTQAMAATLGISQDLTRELRGALSGQFSQLHSPLAPDSTTLAGNAALAWAPAALEWGKWRYSPSASGNAGFSADTEHPRRHTEGVQAAHALTRDLPLAEGSALAIGLAQSGGVIRESATPQLARALAHSASLGWQHSDAFGGQRFGGVTVSESRTWGGSSGRFDLVNLQLSQRSQLSRFSSWQANLTWQATRNETSELDVFSGQRRAIGAGWQRYYNGSASYESQRAFGVPRLRGTVLLGINSQPLERRALGDIDAPRERITASLESRLEYAIGRLETRLAARAARVDGKTVGSVQARAQRRF